jgi:hypothetical protein
MQYKFIVYFFFINFLTFFSFQHAQSQASAGELKLLHKLDSISNASSVSCYFADVYFVTMENAIQFFANADNSAKKNIRLMELRFANYFFSSAEAYANKQEIPSSWQAYYADTSSSPVRHLLLGVNAHINGDIWKALVASFSLEEIKALKPTYNSYYSGLLDIYEDVYQTAYAESRLLKTVHTACFGLDKWYGKILLHRWINRQLKLACLYYSNPTRFREKQKSLDRKMDRMNRLVKRYFN